MTHPELLNDTWRPPRRDRRRRHAHIHDDAVALAARRHPVRDWRHRAHRRAGVSLLRSRVHLHRILPPRTAQRIAGKRPSRTARDCGPLRCIRTVAAFYEDLAKSGTVLGRIIDDTTRIIERGTRRSLADALSARGATPALQREAALTRLTSAIRAATNSKTGVVSVRVRTQSPRLSQWIAQRVLDELASFNRERRQTNATNERRFAQARLVEATTELTAAGECSSGFLGAQQR